MKEFGSLAPLDGEDLAESDKHANDQASGNKISVDDSLIGKHKQGIPRGTKTPKTKP